MPPRSPFNWNISCFSNFSGDGNEFLLFFLDVITVCTAYTELRLAWPYALIQICSELKTGPGYPVPLYQGFS